MADMAELVPSFARNPAAAAYYEDGAAEYDDWYLGIGQYAERDRSECHTDLVAARGHDRCPGPCPNP